MLQNSIIAETVTRKLKVIELNPEKGIHLPVKDEVLGVQFAKTGKMLYLFTLTAIVKYDPYSL